MSKIIERLNNTVKLCKIALANNKLEKQIEDDDLCEIIDTANDAIEELEKNKKVISFTKGFNDMLCAELAKKNIPNYDTTENNTTNHNSEYEFADKYGTWVKCSDHLPKSGENIILLFKDTFHTHESWPKIQVLPAWRCNVGQECSPDGEWAIEGRCWNGIVIDLEDGIAWMPLPNKPEVTHD